MANEFDLPPTPRPPPARKQIAVIVWISVAVAIPMLMLVGCCGVGMFLIMSSNQDRSPRRQDDANEVMAAKKKRAAPVASLTPQQLYDSYVRNEAKADMDFTNKHVELVGFYVTQFNTVRKDNGRYVYDFRHETLWDSNFAAPRPTVTVVFLDSEIPRISVLKMGDKLTIRGTCSGRVVNDFSYGGKYVAVVDATVKVTAPINNP